MQNSKVRVVRKIFNVTDKKEGFDSSATQVTIGSAFNFLIALLSRGTTPGYWSLFEFDQESFAIKIMRGRQKDDIYLFHGDATNMDPLFWTVYVANKMNGVDDVPDSPMSRLKVLVDDTLMQRSLDHLRHRAGSHVTGMKRNLMLLLLSTRLGEAVDQFDGSQIAKAFAYQPADILSYYLALTLIDYADETPQEILKKFDGDPFTVIVF